MSSGIFFKNSFLHQENLVTWKMTCSNDVDKIYLEKFREKFGIFLISLVGITVLNVSKYGVFSDPHFHAFGLNMEVSVRVQSKCWKIWARKNFVFRHFSRSEYSPLSSFFEPSKSNISLNIFYGN